MDTKAFSTKTERREKDNPGLKDVKIIGLDMGYSAPKGFHDKGNFCFPNFVQKITNEIFGELNRTDIVYTDLDSGDSYYVGELATKALREDSVVAEDALFGRNHYLHPHFLVAARTALAFALWNDNPTDGSNLFIQTGLPPAYLKKDSVYLKTALAKRHHFLVKNGNEEREFDFTITENQIDIIYQPMGTFYSIMFENDGSMIPNANEYMNSNILLCDGGFGTFDKFFVKGKQLDVKDTNATLGMKRVLEETRDLIKKDEMLGVDISIPAMQSVLKSGKFKKTDAILLREEFYDVAPFLEKANEIVREEAFESIKDYVFDIRYLIMSGGTGAAWYDYFKERLKGIQSIKVIPGNQGSNLPMTYSNARGYYYYRLFAMKNR